MIQLGTWSLKPLAGMQLQRHSSVKSITSRSRGTCGIARSPVDLVNMCLNQ